MRNRWSRRGSLLLAAGGFVLILGGLFIPSAAEATFPNAGNGNVGFIAICDGTIGQAVYSIDPNGNPPSTYSCPGGAAPNYTQATAGSTDSMPYFSADGGTLYFASNRANGGNYAIYSVPYLATIKGSPGSQTDGATPLTSPTANGNSYNDYAPTVDQNGNELLFIRCDSSSTSCTLDRQSPIGGTPSAVTTSQLLAAPDSVSGAANRPEVDPVDPSQVVYVGVDGHIHLVSLSGSFTERDLSLESGVGSTADEHPDWSPDGTKLVFDSNRTGGHKIYTMTMSNPATAAPLWNSDPGTEIEPIYSPSPIPGSSPARYDYIWTKLAGGSNLVIDWGTSVGSPTMLANLTANRTNNSQEVWQPTGPGPSAQAPEAPLALLLPITGVGMIGLALGFEVRRRTARKPAIRG